MPQTPKLGLRYPSPGDRPEVPKDLGVLAGDIENSTLVNPPMRALYRPDPINLPASTWYNMGGLWASLPGLDGGDQSGITYSAGVLQVTRPGVYYVHVSLFASRVTGAGRFVVALRKNGKDLMMTTVPTSGRQVTGMVTDHVPMQAGDTLSLRLWADWAGTRELGGSLHRSRWVCKYEHPF